MSRPAAPPPEDRPPAARPSWLRRGGRRHRRLRRTVAVAAGSAVAAAAVGFVAYRLSRTETYRPGEELPEITRKLAQGLPEEAPLPRFTDVTAAAGLGGFRTFAGERTSQLPEDMGPGAAWGDFDNDGDDDLFLVSMGGPLTAPPAARAASELYENLGDGSFRRVEGFPDTRILGMSAAWGDADGDGWLDLVVTGYDSLLLFRNRQGSFVRDPDFPARDGYWAGAAWGDFDNDRDLDLYVCGYVRYRAEDAGMLRTSQQYGKAVPFTLNPASYEPERNLLFENRGDGRFTEVGEAQGVANPEGRSLTALWHDFDDDGWLDLYVANDISDNVLYRNRGGSFEDVSHAAFVADYRGAMGLAAGDWNRDGDDDLFVSHWIAQENALYDSLLADVRRAGAEGAAPGGTPAGAEPAPPRLELAFSDRASALGLGQIALPFIGWGTEFADLDADGWLDLVVINGSTFEDDGTPKRLLPQKPHLFWSRHGEYFHDLAPLAEALAVAHVGRGLAVSDYDADGDLDLLVVHHGEGAQLLRNDMPQGNWLELRLRSRAGDGGEARGFADGAKVVVRAGEVELRRTVGSSSYLSQSSRTLHFGLGSATGVDALEVRWLGGEKALYPALAANGVWELTEGVPAPRRLEGPPASRAAASPDERARIAEFWTTQRAAMDAMKRQGDIPGAIVLFRQALALDPRHEDSLYYLGNCLAAEGDTAGAMAQFETLTHVNPQSHRGWAQWGKLLAATATGEADYHAAEEALEKAVALNPEETGALLALGEVALLRGDHRRAAARLELACRTNPRAVGGYYLRAYVAWKAGRTSEAQELLATAHQARGPEWKPEGTVAEGDVARRMHRTETAVSSFWESWDGTPEPAAAFAGLDAFLAGRRDAGEAP